MAKIDTYTLKVLERMTEGSKGLWRLKSASVADNRYTMRHIEKRSDTSRTRKNFLETSVGLVYRKMTSGGIVMVHLHHSTTRMARYN